MILTGGMEYYNQSIFKFLHGRMLQWRENIFFYPRTYCFQKPKS